MEIYRFLPPILLEKFDSAVIEDPDMFLEWVAKARYIQELEEEIIARAIVKAFL